MKQFPSIPRAANAPNELFEHGHLWILEKVDGANFRFQLQESGLIRFGDRNNVYDGPDAVPEPYQHAVRYVREHIDRGALRTAVDDVENIVFFGEATHHHTIEYDWGRTPSFLGFDIWSAEKNTFLTPDVVQGIFERLNLDPVNPVERELPARDFDPEKYSLPKSAWYDGPAEGVVIRNKRGQRAKLLHPDFRDVAKTVPLDSPADELAATYATERRIKKLAVKLQNSGGVTFDALFDRVLEDIVREKHKQLYHSSQPVDMRVFRSEVAALTQEFLDDFDGR